MSYVTLNETKQHLNIELDDIVDDYYIEMLIDVAEEYLKLQYDLDLVDITQEYGHFPVTLKHVLLLTIADYFENRTTITTVSTTPKIIPTIDRLIQVWKNYNF